MLTTIEVTSRAIRLCRVENRRLTVLESFPVPPGADPLQVLASAPLPGPLGKVRVAMQHPDLLLRTMVQPPCPAERLGKIVRFELQGAGDTEPVNICWHLVKALGSGDMRLLTMVAKRKLIDQLKAALATHGGKLAALTHPAIGLFRAYREVVVGEQGASIVVDVGGQSLHLALVVDGDLLFVRSQTPGMDDLVKQVMEMRNLPEAETAVLVAKLGKGAPADLHEAIKRHAGQVASVLTANLRFAKAQLRVDQFEPKTVWVAGAGAQVHGFCEALSERMGIPVKPLNPFAGTTPALSFERLDRHSALPSPWTVAIGAARAPVLELDALSEERERRALFWRGEGALRIAAAAVLALFVLAIARIEMGISGTEKTIDTLEGANKGGLVPTALAARKKLDEIGEGKALDTSRLSWIDGERRPGRIAIELLGAIAAEEHPTNCPVFLQAYRLARQPGQVVIEIEGYAEGSGARPTDSILHSFEQGLIKRYPPITALKQLPKPATNQRHQFHYIISIADQPAEVLSSESGKGVLTLSLAVPSGIDPAGAARVAALRARKGEESAVVKVVSTDPAGKGKTESQDVTLSFGN